MEQTANMPRPLNRAQTRQNAAFLAELRRTGNARAAAATLGLHRATLTKRRAKHPAFALEWDAALAVANAALRKSSPERGGGPSAKPMVEGASSHADRSQEGPLLLPPFRSRVAGRSGSQPDLNDAGHRSPATGSGVGTSSADPHPTPQPHLHQTAKGHLQLRTGKARRIDHAAEQAFLAALSATANVRLSAAAAGFSHASFYARRRRNPAFAREMQLALELGYERLEMALLASFQVEAHAHDDWRHNEPPPIPSMTPAQALQLLYLHHKTARLWAEAPYMNNKRGETTEAWCARRAADYTAAQARETERLKIEATNALLGKALDRVERALARDAAKAALPALDQVTGWSKADAGKVPHDAGRALFGGWRLDGKR